MAASREDLKNKPCPLLTNFLRWLNNPAAQETQLSKILTLNSLLYSFITGERTIAKTNLSMTCHGLCRSKELVNIIHRTSHGISYTDDLALCEASIDEGCPLRIAKHVPATVELDHDDFRDDTYWRRYLSPNKRHVSAAWNSWGFWFLRVGSHCPNRKIWKISQVKQLRLNSIRPSKEAYQSKVEGSHTVKKIQRKFEWIVLFMFWCDLKCVLPAENQIIGAFAGFQASIHKYVVKSKPYYYLTLPKPPHKSVVNEVMDRVTGIARKMSMPLFSW